MQLNRAVGCFSHICVCNFGALFGQYISLFFPCNLAVSWYPLQCNLFVFSLSCLIRSWQSLASVDILVSKIKLGILSIVLPH